MFDRIYLDNLQLEIFHKQKKKQDCICIEYLKKLLSRRRKVCTRRKVIAAVTQFDNN